MDDLDIERLKNLIKHNEYATDDEVKLMGCLPYFLWFITTLILVCLLAKK